jgi:hypothetical protein
MNGDEMQDDVDNVMPMSACLKSAVQQDVKKKSGGGWLGSLFGKKEK